MGEEKEIMGYYKTFKGGRNHPVSKELDRVLRELKKSGLKKNQKALLKEFLILKKDSRARRL